MKNDLEQAMLGEEVKDIRGDFDLKTYSATVFYSSSFGSGGGSSSFGGGGSSSSFGSPRSSTPSYGTGPGSPDYEARHRPDPSGPLSKPIEFRPIVADLAPATLPAMDFNFSNLGNNAIDFSKMLQENKALQGVLGNLPGVPSRFGAPEIPDYTQRLSEVVNKGMPSVPSRFGSAGDNDFGLQNKEKFQFGYNLPNTGVQLHIHGKNENIITHAHIYSIKDLQTLPKDKLKPLSEITGYGAARAAHDAEMFGFKKFGK